LRGLGMGPEMKKPRGYPSLILIAAFLKSEHDSFMSRRFFHTFFLFTLFGGLTACSSAPVKKATPSAINRAKAADEPCWIRTPDCTADAENTALYFVGQSNQPLASWGRPKRASVHSAQSDAEQQYARYLGVDIKSSTYLRSLFKNEHYQSQFKETVSQSVDHTVSELIKADEYSVAHQQTEDGEPLWTVYVLIKIAKENAKKHRLALAEEPKRRAQAPPTADEWTVSVFNIDDHAAIYANGKKIHQCEFSRNCTVKLNPHLKSGRNKVRLEYSNRAMFWTYGYKVLKNDEVMYTGRCGQVWVFGCSWNISLGVVHSFEFEVEKP
jgi:hypothetical protein